MSVIRADRLPGRLQPVRRDHPEPRRRWSPQRRRDALAGYAFLTPWTIGLVAITALPVFASLYLSFTEYSAGGEPRWIGFENYLRMVGDDRFWSSLRVTLLYVLTSVPLLLVFALLLAVVLNRGLRLLPIYRSLYYLPSLLGGSVAIAVLWRRIFGPEGVVNSSLSFIGVQGPNWLADPAWAPLTLVFLNVWTFGAPMVIFLAGLRQVPQELYDAASVDGAGASRRFRHITLPQLSPVMLFNGVITMIGAFQAFTGAYVISNGSGGPLDSTLFYTLYLYQTGFSYFDFGYASALAWVLLVVIAGATGATYALTRRRVFYGDEQ